MPSTKIGFLLWPQTASWPELRDAAALADRFRAAFWTDRGYPALALDRDGRQVEALTSSESEWPR